MRRREQLAAFLFVLPACALIGLFVLWPGVLMIKTSLFRQGLVHTSPATYCGSENFGALPHDAEFVQALGNTVKFTVAVVPIQTALALVLAIWVNGSGASRRWLRLAVFLPTTLSLAVLSVVWRLMLEPMGATGGGLLNGLLTAVHLPGQPFLTSPSQALWCIVAMSVWQGVGFQMLILLAGLQTVPDQLYEAATLDGARRWRRFWHVTLPGIAPTLVLVVMVTTIFALKLFVQPYVMTGGGPRGSTISLVQYMFRAAFRQRDLGLACAAGSVLLVAALLLTLVQWRVARRSEATS